MEQNNNNEQSEQIRRALLKLDIHYYKCRITSLNIDEYQVRIPVPWVSRDNVDVVYCRRECFSDFTPNDYYYVVVVQGE